MKYAETVQRSPIKRYIVYHCVHIQYSSNPYLVQWLASALDVSAYLPSQALLLFRRELAVVCKARIHSQNKIKDRESVLHAEQQHWPKFSEDERGN